MSAVMLGSSLNRRRMWRARLLLVLVGVSIPYLARIPGAFVRGTDWATSYLSAGFPGFVFIQSFNSLAWGSLLALSFLVRKPSPLVAPSLTGLGFVAVAHARLDLAADAQNSVAVAFIPVYAFPIIGVTFLVSVLLMGRGSDSDDPSQSLESSEAADRSPTFTGPPA